MDVNDRCAVGKCNNVRKYPEKFVIKLKLNLGKSGYMIITADNKTRREKLMLNNGYIKYKHMKYLGVLISDTGSIMKDVDLFINGKRGHIYTKYTNYCSRNYLAPLQIKLKVLTSCVASTIIYGCETWGKSIPKGIEQVYRIAIKTALSMRSNTNNEIVYLESGLYPLEATIRRRQLAFWLRTKEAANNNAVIRYVVETAIRHNVEYITST